MTRSLSWTLHCQLWSYMLEQMVDDSHVGLLEVLRPKGVMHREVAESSPDSHARPLLHDKRTFRTLTRSLILFRIMLAGDISTRLSSKEKTESEWCCSETRPTSLAASGGSGRQ